MYLYSYENLLVYLNCIKITADIGLHGGKKQIRHDGQNSNGKSSCKQDVCSVGPDPSEHQISKTAGTNVSCNAGTGNCSESDGFLRKFRKIFTEPDWNAIMDENKKEENIKKKR